MVLASFPLLGQRAAAEHLRLPDHYFPEADSIDGTVESRKDRSRNAIPDLGVTGNCGSRERLPCSLKA